MTEVNEELLKQKVNAYYKSGTIVHISFKKGYWKRGMILELSSDFFMLQERLEGEMPVFFSEIEDIAKFIPKERGQYVNTN